MTIKVLVPIANGTEEVEAITIIDLLRRAGIEVTVAGISEQVVCSRGVRIIPDVLLDELDDSAEFDSVILPGGIPGVNHLAQNKKLKHFVQRSKTNNNLIGAICAAPKVLKEYETLEKNAKITSHPATKSELFEYNYNEENVVIDGNLITSRGVGTAIDFSLAIIENLLGKDIARKVANDIVYNNYN